MVDRNAVCRSRQATSSGIRLWTFIAQVVLCFKPTSTCFQAIYHQNVDNRKCLYTGCNGNFIGMWTVGIFAEYFSNVNYSGRWSGTVSKGEKSPTMFTFGDKLGNSIEFLQFGRCLTCWNRWSNLKRFFVIRRLFMIEVQFVAIAKQFLVLRFFFWNSLDAINFEKILEIICILNFKFQISN